MKSCWICHCIMGSVTLVFVSNRRQIMFMTCFAPDTLSIARPTSTRSATSLKTCESLCLQWTCPAVHNLTSFAHWSLFFTWPYTNSALDHWLHSRALWNRFNFFPNYIFFPNSFLLSFLRFNFSRLNFNG